MLASHGALLSDERLPLVVLDMRKLKVLEGRVLAHGEEELGKGAGITFGHKQHKSAHADAFVQVDS